MKKILYIVSTLKKSGPTNQLSYIIKYLDRNKFQPIVLTLSPEPEDSMMEYFKANLDVKVDSLNLSRIDGFIKGVAEIKKYIRDNNIDIVHSQGIRADWLIKNIDIPKVSTLRNYPYYDYPLKFGKLKGNIMAFYHMRIIKSNSKYCITCAKSISKEFERNQLCLPYIQNGVDTEKFKPLSKEEKDSLKEKLNIDKKKKIYITVGSLIPRKDMETVIKGFKLFNRDRGSILFVAGDGFEKNNLKNIADDSIVFLGNISNVVEYLQISDCFISASLAEGLPNTILEAMACGLPTVLSDIPSHREIYENEKGNFFKTKDVSNLSILLELIDDEFDKQHKLSLKIIKEKFSAKVMSEKYQKIYIKKINTNRKCPVCNSMENKMQLVKNEYKITKCTNCNHVYVLNPNEDTISSLEKDAKIDNYKTRHYQIYKLIKNLYQDKNINIAEIGSGIGNFAHLISKDKKFNYVGFEPSRERYEFSKKYNLNIKNELFEPSENFYDVIIMDNVLEHVENPSYIFNIVSKSLKRGGGIYSDSSK